MTREITCPLHPGSQKRARLVGVRGEGRGARTVLPFEKTVQPKMPNQTVICDLLFLKTSNVELFDIRASRLTKNGCRLFV